MCTHIIPRLPAFLKVAWLLRVEYRTQQKKSRKLYSKIRKMMKCVHDDDDKASSVLLCSVRLPLHTKHGNKSRNRIQQQKYRGTNGKDASTLDERRKEYGEKSGKSFFLLNIRDYLSLSPLFCESLYSIHVQQQKKNQSKLDFFSESEYECEKKSIISLCCNVYDGDVPTHSCMYYFFLSFFSLARRKPVRMCNFDRKEGNGSIDPN